MEAVSVLFIATPFSKVGDPSQKGIFIRTAFLLHSWPQKDWNVLFVLQRPETGQKHTQQHADNIILCIMCISVCHKKYLLSCLYPGAFQIVIDHHRKLFQFVAYRVLKNGPHIQTISLSILVIMHLHQYTCVIWFYLIYDLVCTQWLNVNCDGPSWPWGTFTNYTQALCISP